MKRLFRLLMIGAVTVTTLGAFGAVSSPAIAAPAHAAAPALAAMMPANIDLYAEINVGELTTSLITLNNTFSPAGSAAAPTTLDQIPGQVGAGIKMVDAQLSQLLGYKATLSGDLFNWLTEVAVGLPISDAMLQGTTTGQGAVPAFLVAGAVKDEAAADKFLTASLATIAKKGLAFPQTAVKINGQAATRYDNPLVKISIVRLPGYVLIGADSVVDAMAKASSSSPSLATNASFQKTMALLITDNNVTVFASSRLLAYGIAAANKSRNMMRLMPGLMPGMMPAATPEAAATMSATANAAMTAREAELMKAFNGVAIGARTVNKTFAIDVVASVDMAAIKTMIAQVSTQNGLDLSQLISASDANTDVSGKLTNQIPTDAVAVFEGHDLTRLYTTMRSFLNTLNTQVATMPGMNADQKQQISNAVDKLNQFETLLKSQFNLDINTDVLVPLAGDFAVFGYLNTDTAATPSPNKLPFSPALIIDTADAAKAKDFADKLAAGLPAVANITPTKTSDGLYTFSVGPAETTLAYGVSANTFVLTTGDALGTVTGAIAGKNTLDASATWKAAKAILPSTYSTVLYLNLNVLDPYLTSMAATRGMGGANQMGQAFLKQLDSALIYSARPDANSSVLTLAFTLK